MNKKKAIALISKSSGITLYQDIDGSSWLSNGYALYNMGKFPHCDSEDEVASVLGLTEKQAAGKKITISYHFPFALGTMKQFTGLYPANFSITTACRKFYILTSEKVAVAVDADFIKPFNLSEETSFYAYFTNENDRIALVAVVYGMITVGYICPQDIDNDQIDIMRETIMGLKNYEVSDDVQL
jgi:hypothetical protein